MRLKQILLATWLAATPLFSLETDYYVTTTDLNLRTGAGAEFSVSFTLQKGTEVEVLSKESDWYKIRYLGNTGYAHSKYLNYTRTTSDSSPHTPERIGPYILIGICVSLTLLVVFIIYGKIRDNKLLDSVTERRRGTKTERDLVLKLLKYGIPAQAIFHDLYVEKRRGEFSQIDLVAVTEVGIIVFEVKDYSGWIFGSGNQSQWTQVLAYGKRKYRFYNPIMQNNKHIAELRKQLIPFGDIPHYSIVTFYGNCVLKEINFVPNGTFLVKSERVLDVVKVILKDNKPVHYTNEKEVARILKEAMINGGMIENQIQHNENIKDMLGKQRIFD